MAASGAQSVGVDECMPLGFVGTVAAAHGIGFVGNVRVSAASGAGRATAREDALVAMAAGSTFPGYVFGTGGPLPYDLDAETLRDALRGKEAFERTYARATRPCSGLSRDTPQNRN